MTKIVSEKYYSLFFGIQESTGLGLLFRAGKLGKTEVMMFQMLDNRYHRQNSKNEI